MLNLQLILFSQYPALLLLSLLFLIANLRVRKKSTVKSILWSILFAVSLAAAIVFCFLGLQADYWTLRTLLPFPLWSWAGIILVLFFALLRITHGIESSLQRRKLARELKKAEKEKEAAVEQAREEGRAEALSAAAPTVSEDVNTASGLPSQDDFAATAASEPIPTDAVEPEL